MFLSPESLILIHHLEKYILQHKDMYKDTIYITLQECNIFYSKMLILLKWIAQEQVSNMAVFYAAIWYSICVFVKSSSLEACSSIKANLGSAKAIK